MRVRTNLFMGAAALAISASQANAEGYYFEVFGGYSLADATVTTFKTASASYTNIPGLLPRPGSIFGTTIDTVYRYDHSSTAFSFDADSGWVIGGALGYAFQGNLRADVEIAYRSDSIDGAHLRRTRSRVYLGYDGGTYYGAFTATITPASNRSAEGDLTAWSLMTDVWFDLFDGPIVPTIGAGIGVASLNVEASGGGGARSCIPLSNVFCSGVFAQTVRPTTTVDDSAVTFAYQFGTGVGVEIWGSAVLSGQYRYFGTTDADLGTGEVSYSSHDFLISLRVPLGN